MEVPPDEEIVILCHCRPCRRPKGYVPDENENQSDSLLDIVSNINADEDGIPENIRTLSDDTHFVDVECPDATMERNNWSDIADGTVRVVWAMHCPILTVLRGEVDKDGRREVFDQMMMLASAKLKVGGVIVFPLPAAPPANFVYDAKRWKMEWTTTFPFTVTNANDRDYVKINTPILVFTKQSAAGGRRRTRASRLRAAKKKCYPGYDVYDYRKNSKGEFFNCAPAGLKRRKTRRRA